MENTKVKKETSQLVKDFMRLKSKATKERRAKKDNEISKISVKKVSESLFSFNYLRRLNQICEILGNPKSKKEIFQELEERGVIISENALFRCVHVLKHSFGAPIMYNVVEFHYQLDENYDFKQALLKIL